MFVGQIHRIVLSGQYKLYFFCYYRGNGIVRGRVRGRVFATIGCKRSMSVALAHSRFHRYVFWMITASVTVHTFAHYMNYINKGVETTAVYAAKDTLGNFWPSPLPRLVVQGHGFEASFLRWARLDFSPQRRCLLTEVMNSYCSNHERSEYDYNAMKL